MDLTELLKVRRLYHLKNVSRQNSVQKRKESSAEHSWSCLVLADFLLSSYDFRVDREKVLDLLLYHDVVEIEAGDVCITDIEGRQQKKESERKALRSLQKQIPKVLSKKFEQLFDEYEAQNTREARFAHAVDKLDAQLHELDYKRDWRGWDEKMFCSHIERYMIEFPQLRELFEQFVAYVIAEGYFNQ